MGEISAELAGSNRQRHPLARGIELLTVMIDGDKDTYGVRELAGHLGVSPSTAHRLINDLEGLGLVGRTPEGAYRLGLEFLRLAWTTAVRFPWNEAAGDILYDLTERSGESSFFGVYNGQRRQMMFTLAVESPHPLRYAVQLRTWTPLHSGAGGLAILAFLPDDVQQEITDGPLASETDRAPVTKESLLERLAVIRADGYAISHGERTVGAITIAAPVFGPGGDVIGSTGITIPDSRFNAAFTSSMIELVRQAANTLIGQMSHTRTHRF